MPTRRETTPNDGDNASPEAPATAESPSGEEAPPRSEAEASTPAVARLRRLGENAQGLVEYFHERSRITFVLLPGGSCRMGSPEDGRGKTKPDEYPEHEVTLDPFLIAKHEVTQEQWTRVMGVNPSQFTGRTRPVENVSWEDCQEFCARTGLSLPTEAQWEYACRAGTTGEFSGSGRASDMGWCAENSGGETHAVGKKRPNAFGLHDTHGNVLEWCQDVYDRDFYSKEASRRRNPVSESGSKFRVCRGGDFANPSVLARSANRGGDLPEAKHWNIGFRPVLNRVP